MHTPLSRWIAAIGWLLLAIAPQAAQAQSLRATVEIEGVYTDTTFAERVPSIASSPEAVLSEVVPGNGIRIVLSVQSSGGSQPPVDDFYSTLVVDGAELIFLNAVVVSNEILVKTQPPASLSLISAPAVKPNSPSLNGTPGEVWIQATAYENLTGGDVSFAQSIGFIELDFEVSPLFDASVSQRMMPFSLTLTAGDSAPGTFSSNTVQLLTELPPGDLDTDGDLVADVFDNCLLTPNGQNERALQGDVDGDGNGDFCDCDFVGGSAPYEGDGLVLGDDISFLFSGFSNVDRRYDVTGDGSTLGDDVQVCFSRFNTPVGDPR